MDSRADILARDWPDEFDELCKNRIVMSHYKYGWMSQTYPELAQAVKSIQTRLDLYNQTHNIEHLLDVANFARIEYAHPSYHDAHFRATGSAESPGLTDGISYNEMMRDMDG